MGAFARLSPQEQGTIIREDSVLDRAYGDADLIGHVLWQSPMPGATRQT